MGKVEDRKSGPIADREPEVLAKIGAMPEPFRAVGHRLHGLIRRSAPELQPTLWYGMPAYAKDGNTICFFRADKKYMTFGFTPDANLAAEEGAGGLMVSSWYLTGLDGLGEAKLSAAVRRAANDE